MGFQVGREYLGSGGVDRAVQENGMTHMFTLRQGSSLDGDTYPCHGCGPMLLLSGSQQGVESGGE